MANVHASITPELEAFIKRQVVYFVSTAPLSPAGHVNLSPKGLDTLQVLSPQCVAYLDLTGSGNETAAHLMENGRITLMFCAFEGPPLILRLFGAGRPVRPSDAQWDDLLPRFPQLPGLRQFIVVDISRVQTSCGTGVPLMRFEGHRDALTRWAANKGPAGIAEYQQKRNLKSIDGLPTSITPVS